jgi:hypothetical protein
MRPAAKLWQRLTAALTAVLTARLTPLLVALLAAGVTLNSFVNCRYSTARAKLTRKKDPKMMRSRK